MSCLNVGMPAISEFRKLLYDIRFVENIISWIIFNGCNCQVKQSRESLEGFHTYTHKISLKLVERFIRCSVTNTRSEELYTNSYLHLSCSLLCPFHNTQNSNNMHILKFLLNAIVSIHSAYQNRWSWIISRSKFIQKSLIHYAKWWS